MSNVTVAVHRGAMFMAHIADVKDGMLQQETAFVRGLSQNGAEQAIAAYVEGLYSPSDLGVRNISPVVMLPGACTLIMLEEQHRATPGGTILLLPCKIQRTAFNESRLVTVREHAWEFYYLHLLDANRQPLERHLPVHDGEAIDGFLKVRWIRQEGENSMVELPNCCAFDCIAGELVRP